MQFDWHGEGSGAGFDLFITSVIYFNVLIMAMYYWSPPPASEFPVFVSETYEDPHATYTFVLESLNIALGWVFVLEFLVKVPPTPQYCR